MRVGVLADDDELEDAAGDGERRLGDRGSGDERGSADAASDENGVGLMGLLCRLGGPPDITAAESLLKACLCDSSSDDASLSTNILRKWVTECVALWVCGRRLGGECAANDDPRFLSRSRSLSALLRALSMVGDELDGEYDTFGGEDRIVEPFIM